MDWKKIIATAAPGPASTALGGPPAGGVVSILADKVLGGSGDAVARRSEAGRRAGRRITPELRADPGGRSGVPGWRC